jgi:galactokinase/mevalonate kinase-like predicted kinase
MNDELIKIENEIKNTVGVRAYKLCGAGGGGFFLCLCDKEIFEFELNAYRIHLNNKGTEAFYV